MLGLGRDQGQVLGFHETALVAIVHLVREHHKERPATYGSGLRETIVI
jgi:hypothetical protein